MDAKLTYLIFLTFAASLVSSCSPDTPDNVEVSDGSEMKFAVAELSRASVTTSFNQFALYGDMKFPVEDATTPTGLFLKTQVDFAGGEWTYDGPRYWFQGHEHTFVAISPVSALETSGTPQYLNSRLSFTYTIPTESGNIVARHKDVADIIVATHRRMHDPDNSTVVFRFGHIMSLINVSPAFDDNIMAEEAYIEIHEMELSGFKTKANFSILPAPRQSENPTDDRVIDLSGHEADGRLTVNFPEPVEIANNSENVNLFDGLDAIIMLPQEFPTDSDAKITLSYTIYGDPTMRHLTLPLKGKTWETGKSYNYTFTLNRRGLVSESTTITEWDEMNVGNIDAH